MASRGAKLSLADVSDDGLQQVKKGLESKYNAEIIAMRTDVRDYNAVEAWITETMKRFGRLDGAANIAGVIPKSIGIDSMAEQDLDDWDFVFSVSDLLTYTSCRPLEVSITTHSSPIQIEIVPWTTELPL